MFFLHKKKRLYKLQRSHYYCHPNPYLKKEKKIKILTWYEYYPLSISTSIILKI